MGLITTLRTAFALAAEVQQLRHRVAESEHIVTDLQLAWTDTLDKLLAREERWRKRYRAQLDEQLQAPQLVPAAPVAQDRASHKAHLRAVASNQRRIG